MKRYKKIFTEEKLDEGISNKVQKIIDIYGLTRRLNESRLFFEGYGVGSHNDIPMIKKYISDFSIIPETNSAYTWVGFSKKELITISYTEGDIYLIIHPNSRELEKDIKSSIDWAKENI